MIKWFKSWLRLMWRELFDSHGLAVDRVRIVEDALSEDGKWISGIEIKKRLRDAGVGMDGLFYWFMVKWEEDGWVEHSDFDSDGYGPRRHFRRIIK